ncbi:MAG: hypothetical protein AAGA60_21375 [Cyanobacteria bacterium P01_E01_bin.42]
MSHNGNGNDNGNGTKQLQEIDARELLHIDPTSLSEEVDRQHSPKEVVGLEYKRRLYSLFVEKVQRTGRMEHPQLLQWLQRVYDVDTALHGQILMPELLEALKNNLKESRDRIARACQEILKKIGEVAEKIGSNSLDSSAIERLTPEIARSTGCLQGAVAYLIDETETHTQSSLHAEATTDEYKIANLIRELEYLTAYIAERAQVRYIQQELLPGDSPERYFRRLYLYLSLCPCLAEDLGACIANILSKKVARPKFLAPELQDFQDDDDNSNNDE